MASIDTPHTKMAPVTVYVLKKDRLALLEDLTDIIKAERITLSARCTERLEACLMATLEPTLIPYDHKDLDRAINMANSARLRAIKAAGKEKRATTSKHTAKSHRQPDLVPTTRFGRFGGPRNVNQSFIDRDFIPPDAASESEDEGEDEALATAEAAKRRLESRRNPPTDTYNRFGGPCNINEPFISTANVVRDRGSENEPRAVVRASQKIKSNASFAHHPPEFKKRADALVKDEPIDTTRGDLLSVPAPKTRQNAVEQVSSTGHHAGDTLAPPNEVMNDPKLITVKAKNDIAHATIQTSNTINISTTHSTSYGTTSPVPTITITPDFIAGTQESSNSSNSSRVQNFSQDTQDPQHTPTSTYPPSQPQGPLTQPGLQSPIRTRAIDPEDLLRPPTPAPRKKKALRTSNKAIESNPRRSARVAEKNPSPAPKLPKAPKATAPAPSALSPILKPSAKRSRNEDVEDDGDDQREVSSHNKKVVSGAVVEKQREMRGKETAKRGGRNRRSALERRGV